MIPDKNTNFVYFSKLMETEKEYAPIYKEIVKILDKNHVQHALLENTKDIWARDYMPVQVSDKKFIEYRYDPDYLQGISEDARPTKTYPDIVCATNNFGIDDIEIVKTDIILDGGNLVKSKDVAILVDKVVEENAHNYTREELIAELKRLLKVKKLILIPWYLKCEYGHADGMLRFINDNEVLISGLYNYEGDGFRKRLLEVLNSNGLTPHWLVSDKPGKNEEDCSYINFLQVGNLIIVPGLNKERKDKKAKEIIEDYFPSPEYIVEQVSMPEITRKGGALNCITWTVKK